MLAEYHCTMTFDYNSYILFRNNTAAIGATIFCIHNSQIIVKGYSSIAFKDLAAKWCANVCLPYPDETDAILIDSDGIVWCNNLKAFNCLSDKCYCNDLKMKLSTVKGNQVVNITDRVLILSSIVDMHSQNISIIGYNNPVVICINDSGLKIKECDNITIKGITWIGCGATEAIRVLLFKHTPVLAITDSNNVIIQKCSFLYSMGKAISLMRVSGYVNITKCAFVNSSQYRGNGTAIYYRFSKVFNVVTIENCDFTANKDAKSIIYIKQYRQKILGLPKNITYVINSSFHNNEGVPIYLSSRYHILHIIGDVLFENNIAENGAGIYITDHSTVKFGKNSNTRFINNFVYHNGAAIFLNNNSSAIFDNSEVTFNDNTACYGTIYSKHGSSVMFMASCNVTFSRNSATQYGAAIYSFDNSQVIFTGNATASFNNNSNDIHPHSVGAIFSDKNCCIIFEANSITVFSDNRADFGAAVYSTDNSNVIFKDSSRVLFNNNIAHFCGVLISTYFSNITFTDNTQVTFWTNIVINSNYKSSGGTICFTQIGVIIFQQHSLVTFTNNKADRAGAVIIIESNVIIEEYSTVVINNNFGFYYSGGTFVCLNNSNITIKDNSNTTFKSNGVNKDGGAIYSSKMCTVTFKDNSTSSFINNIAKSNGGAIFSNQTSIITFEGNSTVKFDGNTADNGGVFYFTNSTIIFKESSRVSFYDNKARQCGGVGYLNLNSQVVFEGTINVRFDNNLAKQIAGALYSAMSNTWFKGNASVILSHNKATLNGGALYIDQRSNVSFSEFTQIIFRYNRAFCGGAILANDHSYITTTGNAILLFTSNVADQSGGAVYFNYSCNFIIKENTVVKFYYNNAFKGGAVCINDKTKLVFEGKSTAFFNNNLATVDGGAMKILNDSSKTLEDHSDIKFTNNNAQYGGAVFLDTTAVMMVNSSYKNSINFTNNIAEVSGNSVYQDGAQFCNSSCISDSSRY